MGGFFSDAVGAISGGIGGIIDTGASLFQAERNQDFSEKQMKNKWQWQVADMKKAGINPLYGLGGSPPTPSGSSSVSSHIAESATSGYTAQTGRELARSEVELNTARAEVERVTAPFIEAQTGVAKVEAEKLQQDIYNLMMTRDKTRQESILLRLQANVTEMDLRTKTLLQPLVVAITKNQLIMSNLGIPRLRNMADLEESGWGKWLRSWGIGVGDIIDIAKYGAGTAFMLAK